MEIQITEDKLYSMIKNAVKDVLREERMDIILKATPYVSDEEMEEIEKIHGTQPPKEKEIARTMILDI